MFGRILRIDYERIAEHLLDNYSLFDGGEIDNPLYCNSLFNEVRTILDDHVRRMMDVSEPHDVDKGLTEIILKDHCTGEIDEVVITKNPGIVVRVNGHSLKLPLILIERNFKE